MAPVDDVDSSGDLQTKEEARIPVGEFRSDDSLLGQLDVSAFDNENTCHLSANPTRAMINWPVGHLQQPASVEGTPLSSAQHPLPLFNRRSHNFLVLLFFWLTR